MSSGEQLLLALGHRDACGIEDFMPAVSNREALAWLGRWPAWPAVALLLLYNRLAERGGHLLLTARRPVAGWAIGLADLGSRLRAAPSVAIGSPDDDLLAALLLKLFDDRQLEVSDDVIGYLVRHMERSFAAARAAVEALDADSLRQQRPVTVALARAVLSAQDVQPG
jgi:chromosomal replication initiation ATPase DnaA